MSTSVPKSVPLARPDTRMPDKIGKYVVVREVGRGSTGIVYLSHDAYYGRDVAIKVYNMDTGGDEERARSEEHTSELQSQSNLVCRLLLEKKKEYKHQRSR